MPTRAAHSRDPGQRLKSMSRRESLTSAHAHPLDILRLC